MKLNQKGQMPKPAVIGIITVVALLIILSLLFFTGTFVGQAILVSENVPEFQAGVFLDENTMDVGSSATIPVVANLGNAKSTAFGLALKVNGLTYDCDDSQSILSGFVNNQVENTDLITLKNIGCNNDILNAEVAWICSPPEGDDECPNALTGEIEFTEVNVDAPSSQGAASIEFAGFEILSLEDSSNLVTKKGKTIGINEIEEEVELISCNKIGQVGCNADGVGIECYQFYAGGPNYCVPAGCSAAVDAEKIKENPDINVALNSCKGMFGLCEWADGFGVECGFNQGDCTGDYCADGFVCVDSTGDNFDKGIKVCSEDPDPDKDGISGTDDQCPDVAGVGNDGCPSVDPLCISKTDGVAFCNNGNLVQCVDSLSSTEIVSSCQWGCTNGAEACGLAPFADFTCTDSDGVNYFTKGQVTGLNSAGTGVVTVDDYCTDVQGGAEKSSGPWVIEEICQQNKAWGTYAECPDNSYCFGGKCIAEICNNGIDDNENNKIDCADLGCANDVACVQEPDEDGDGIEDEYDQCANTLTGVSVDANGCSDAQKDTDNDGVKDNLDQCPGTLAGASVDANGCVVVATQVSCPSIGDYNGDGVTSGKDIVKFSFHALFGDQVAADPSLSGTCGDIGEQSCLIPIKGKYICDNGLSLGSSRTTCLAGCQLGDYNEDGVTNGKDIVKFSFHALFGDQVSADSTLSNNCGASGEQSCLIPIKNKYICDSGLGLSSTQQQCS